MKISFHCTQPLLQRVPSVGTLFLFLLCAPLGFAEKPNILWIVPEDTSPYMGAYGDPINRDHTPVIDQLAADGVLFERAYATSPVCSTSRSAMIVGVHQNRLGLHQHRSSRTTDGEIVPEELRIHLPDYVRTIPELMREAGYFTFNCGKDDYNFHYDRRELYEVGSKPDYKAGQNGWQGNAAEAPFVRARNFDKVRHIWNAREDKSQPWFGQIALAGGKANLRYTPKDAVLGPYDVPMPAYFPEHPVMREEWAKHYNSVRGLDTRVAQIIEKLKADGEYENTVIFFFSDHGNNHSLRHKQFCYDGGIHIPLIIAGSDSALKAGLRRGELVSLLDVSATTLAMAGAELPEYLEGQDLFGENYRAVDYLVTSRDRCDYTIDRIRAVTQQDFSYIRNFHPDRPLLQPQYRDKREINVTFRQLYENGELSDYLAEHWFGERPEEELYDLKSDPDQLVNLATVPAHREKLVEMRAILNSWMQEVGDADYFPEDPRQLKATYELWKDESIIQGVSLNPEYDPFIESN